MYEPIKIKIPDTKLYDMSDMCRQLYIMGELEKVGVPIFRPEMTLPQVDTRYGYFRMYHEQMEECIICTFIFNKVEF
jgi:hypothetical protein